MFVAAEDATNKVVEGQLDGVPQAGRRATLTTWVCCTRNAYWWK